MLGSIMWVIDKIIRIISYFIGRARAPDLRIMLEDNQIYDVAREVSQNKVGLFVHLVIRNDGLSDAEKSTGYIIDVEKLPDNSIKLTKDKLADIKFEQCKEFRNPVQLKWSHEKEGYKPKTIHVTHQEKRPTRLDLSYVFLEENEFHIFTHHHPQGQAVQFGPGIYRFTILAKCAGGKNTKRIVIFWDGNWRKLGITEDIYENDIKRLFEDKEKILSKCKDLISEAESRYKGKKGYLETDATSVEEIHINGITTLGTSVNHN